MDQMGLLHPCSVEPLRCSHPAIQRVRTYFAAPGADVPQPKVKEIAASENAFVAICPSGRVVAWGDPDSGGDLGGAATQLAAARVRAITATDHAFAALLMDGGVVAWGHSYSGGDCKSVQKKLYNISQISASMSLRWVQ